jgi:DNA-binding GntR family transcriptional regulator
MMKEEIGNQPENARRKRGPTIDEVYQKIKEMIYYNRLAPGQKIVYADMAARLHTSSTPVIQALKRLEASRLVIHVHNKGYFVGEITESEARQLYQAREALETYIIPSVIQNLTPQMLDDIKTAFKKHEKANRRMLILVDAQFHLKIAEIAQNEIIYQILKDIFEKIYLKYRPEYMDDEWGKKVVKQHHELLESLREGEAEKTVRIVRKHIKTGMDYVIGSLLSHETIPG